ncbi:hypothetical protein [Bradyrhizobium liaoningense]|uniref:hypothetical protein n=1 Tax=Bradyrhizobium liaoningense TaxID=43992 RepID=UPI001BAC6C0C|nr:hypothetical protein [Bradyrhizobium liaoningense]MBR0946851.1 hypothetical protein [Bradyrhizobium liaoningense]
MKYALTSVAILALSYNAQARTMEEKVANALARRVRYHLRDPSLHDLVYHHERIFIRLIHHRAASALELITQQFDVVALARHLVCHLVVGDRSQGSNRFFGNASLRTYANAATVQHACCSLEFAEQRVAWVFLLTTDGINSRVIRAVDASSRGAA